MTVAISSRQFKVLPEVAAELDHLIALRRDIHAHPELCYEEKRTSDLVAQKLEEWGIEVVRGLGGTGLVGILRSGSSPRAIGLRADMDALPMQEDNTFAHASQHPGKMHACGHDGHTATLLGAAQYLAKHRIFNGTVYFIFQPAEEGGAGARAMIEDGLFERLCKTLDIPFALRPVSREEVFAADEVLISSASKELLPVVTLDGKPIGNGRPGPIYDSLYKAYQQAKVRNAQKHGAPA